MTSSVRTSVKGRSPSCRNWRRRNPTCARTDSGVGYGTLGASLPGMERLLASIYARVALLAYVISGDGLTEELRAIRRRHRSEQPAELPRTGRGPRRFGHDRAGHPEQPG